MHPHFQNELVTLYQADCRAALGSLEEGSVACCVTSPPYWGLRDYDIEGQIGLEETLEGYVGTLAAVFREVRRVLRRDGVLWLNLGDTYNAYNGNRGPSKGKANRRHHEFMPALPKRLRPDLQDAQAQGFAGRAVAGGAGLAK